MGVKRKCLRRLSSEPDCRNSASCELVLQLQIYKLYVLPRLYPIPLWLDVGETW